MAREFIPIGIGELGELSNGQAAQAFGGALLDLHQRLTDPNTSRDSKGWAKGTITVKVTLEARTAADGGGVQIGVEVDSKAPGPRGASGVLQMVGGALCVEATPDNSPQLGLVPRGSKEIQ